jgi:hypothetical protein
MAGKAGNRGCLACLVGFRVDSVGDMSHRLEVNRRIGAFLFFK